ncbi:MAG: nitroreductase [Firmicutes bacterium]|nr:nitroreductase [Bacillota bacterium]MBQ4091708.1 nitroreductase [Bacillota bacterium]MBQ6811336.1 nitroreductase [Bacillota bacterium]
MEIVELKDMIEKRRSFRKYKDVPVDEKTLAKIRDFWENAKTLYPEIGIDAEFLGREQVRSLMKWLPPQVIAIYSESHEWDLENAGFLFQQVDLYIQSLGLGSCWVGLGRPKGTATRNSDKKFVILLTVGYPEEEFRSDISQFKRHTLSEIANAPDEKLEPARLAPSAVNSQPWYFVVDGDTYHLYRTKPGLIKGRSLNDFNRMDVGIALAHLYVAYPDSFCFYRGEHPEKEGLLYIGSCQL